MAESSLRRGLSTLDSPQGIEVEMGGQTLLNFSSNDYLGLAAHPWVKEIFMRAVEKYGAGSGASRLICGSLAPHSALEATLADFKGTQAALTFSSGYAAAVGTVTALVKKGDIVILDKLAHASLVDGARLSTASLRIFPHNDLGQLEQRLAWARKTADPGARILVVTESIFSMDGDRAPLRQIVEIKERYGALLLIDEAHAFGICGRQGRGLADECEVSDGVDINLGTLSKAMGLAGGYIAARAEIIDLVLNKARSFIYSTAPPPAIAAAADEVIRNLFSASEGDLLRSVFWNNVRRFAAARELTDPSSGIIPIICGAEEHALAFAKTLRERGFLVPAVRFPSVPRGQARLRVTFSASHRPHQVDALIAALRELNSREGT